MPVYRIGDGFLASRRRLVEILPRLAALMDTETPRGRASPRRTRAAKLARPPRPDRSWLERFTSMGEALGVLTAARIPCAPVLTHTR